MLNHLEGFNLFQPTDFQVKFSFTAEVVGVHQPSANSLSIVTTKQRGYTT